MRFRYFSVFLLLLLVAASVRAQTGSLELQNLPTYAEVYCDGKPLARPNHKPTARWQLSSGEHELQVEAWVNDRVTAFRRRVTITDVQSLSIRVEPRLVRLVGSMPGMGKQGKPGLRGNAGPKGRPLSTHPISDGTTINALLRESTDILLAEVTAQLIQFQNELAIAPSKPAEASGVFYYRPSYDTKVVAPMADGPLGPQGATGPPGPAGIPGDLLVLKTSGDIGLLSQVTQALGILQLQTAVSELQNEKTRNETTGRGSDISSEGTLSDLDNAQGSLLSLYTPRWKDWLDMRHALAQRSRGQVVCMCTAGPAGVSGAPGPRGKDGEVPEGAPPIVVSEEVLQSLLEQLKADENLQRRIRQLQTKVEQLKNRVSPPDGSTPVIP